MISSSMFQQLLAEFTLLLHLFFILFVVLGALLVTRWKWVTLIHLPSAIWGALIELNHWTCPLTHLENYFRKQANDSGYHGGFIDYYLVPIIYPPGLTTENQQLIGLFVVLINLVIYSLVIFSLMRGKHEQ